MTDVAFEPCTYSLHIDLETYSELDIKKVGTYRYAENAEILLIAYAFDIQPVYVIDLMAGETIPTKVLEALVDPTIIKHAHNAAFEMAVLHNYLGIDIHPEQWECTMIQGYRLGLPGSLDKLGKALGMPEDKQKLSTGKRLIQFFSKPCRPTKANGGRTRNLPKHDPEKWNLFKDYCRQDVEAERAIHGRLGSTNLDTEKRLWSLDHKINSTGVLVDMDLAVTAIGLDERIKAEALEDASRLTGGINPNSVPQTLDWFESLEGYRPKSMDKDFRADYMASGTNDLIKRFFHLKNLIAKTSVKKYQAMLNMACHDHRVRGMLQFYGAQRTGRWAGRGVQLHNLPQNHMKDLDTAREIVKHGSYEELRLCYDNPSDVLSQLIRTAFVARPGYRFIVADFSSIEARIIAWLAGETWRMDVFARGEDMYCISASMMFGVPVVKHGVNGELRAKGKIAELACGYGGGVAALKAFGADRMGLSDAEMQDIIDKWRRRSPNIVKMWQKVEKAAKMAIRNRGKAAFNRNILFWKDMGLMFITLPSGRFIAYPRPKIEVEDEFFKESITYMGAGSKGGWGKVYTWGGKLTENIVQAIARDCLAVAMLRLDEAGYRIVMHVHDEVILEMPEGEGSLEEVISIMSQPIDWAEGLILTADGYETNYYKKD